jgi:hypothetical protein
MFVLLGDAGGGAFRQDPACPFSEAGHDNIRPDRRSLAVALIDVDGLAPGSYPGFDVSPPVTDKEAAREIEAETAGGIQQHAGGRLAARAAVGVIVRTYIDIVDPKPADQRFVDSRDRLR